MVPSSTSTYPTKHRETIHAIWFLRPHWYQIVLLYQLPVSK